MRCERAGKVIHSSEEHAMQHIASMRRAGSVSPDWNAYPCEDHWHIGHNAKKFHKRIRAALQVGSETSSTQRRKRR